MVPRVETSLESAPVTGDPAVLDRFVLTLVENACRYNTDGELVRMATGVADGAARLQVENDGPALTAADVPALFERFHRGGAGSARSRGDAQADGHGLGLAIALAVVETHGGTLNAQPRPGGGLLITARFPT